MTETRIDPSIEKLLDQLRAAMSARALTDEQRRDYAHRLIAEGQALQVANAPPPPEK